MPIKSHKDRLDKLESETKDRKEPPTWYIDVVSPNSEENQRLKLVDGELVEISDRLDAHENIRQAN